MSRPTTLIKDSTLYWTIRLYNDSQVLVDADSTPTVAVRKGPNSVADAVTVTKRSSTTGIYDCEYDPSGESEGDIFTIEESATVSSVTYENSWSFSVEEAAPANFDIMAINGSGEITTSNPASGGGSAHTAEDVRDLILAGDKTPITMAANKVSNVALVDTTTVNTDMRGTDGANTVTPNTVAPDNASIAAILADTNELQQNQGDWATATGFSTFDPASDTVANVTTVGSVTGAVTTDTASREASKATGFSTFDPSTDTVANVTNVAVCASNTDMVGTDNALLAADAPGNFDIMVIDGSGRVTTSNPASGGGSNHTAEDVRDLILAGDKTPIATSTGSVSNVVLVDTTTDLTNGGSGNNAGAATIYSYFTSGNRELPFQADTSGLSTFDASTDEVTTDSASRNASKATGFATPADVSNSQSVVVGAIDSLNDFNPSTDVVQNVDTVQTTVLNSDMRGTNGALLAGDVPANFNVMLIDSSGKVTTSNPASGGGSNHTAEDVRDLILAGDKTPIATATGSVSNVVLVDTTTDLTNQSGGGGDSKEDIYAYFTTGSRQDTFRADTNGLSTFNASTDQVVASNMRGTDGANTIAPANAAITNIQNVTDKLDTMLAFAGSAYQYTEEALENAPDSGGQSATPADIYSYFILQDLTPFQADVNGLATGSDVSASTNQILVIGGAGPWTTGSGEGGGTGGGSATTVSPELRAY